MGRLRHSTVLGALVLSLVALPAEPAPPAMVALVLAAEGAIEPAQEPFTEIQAGQTVSLGADATLLFSHYPSCREVSVQGGRIVFTERTFLVKQGRVREERPVGCPQGIDLPGEGQVAGLTMRAFDTTALAPTPGFIVVGGAAPAFDRWRILQDDRPLAEGGIDGPKFTWPAGHEPLAAGRGYVLELIAGRDGEVRRLPFEVSEGGRRAMTIIRLN